MSDNKFLPLYANVQSCIVFKGRYMLISKGRGVRWKLQNNFKGEATEAEHFLWFKKGEEEHKANHLITTRLLHQKYEREKSSLGQKFILSRTANSSVCKYCKLLALFVPRPNFFFSRKIGVS